MNQGNVVGGKVYSDSLDVDFIDEIQRLLDDPNTESNLKRFDQWKDVEQWLESVKSPFQHPQVC